MSEMIDRIDGKPRGNRFRSFLLNGLLLTAVALFMRFVGMAFQLFITDEAGSEALGLYSVIGGVYGFALTVATSGIQLGTTRMISEALGRSDGGEVRRARTVCFLYAFFFGLLATLLLFFGAEPIGRHLLKDERTIRCLRILSCSLLPVALSSVLNGYFTAVRRVYKNALTGVLEQGARIGITVFLLTRVFPRGIESACLALVLGSVLSELFSAGFLGLLYLVERGRIRNTPTVVRKGELRRRLCGIALPIAFSTYARSGLLTIEHMMIPIRLTSYFGDRSLALSAFGIVHGVVFPILLFPSAILSSYSGLLIPEIAECKVREERERIRRIVTLLFRVSLIFSIGVAGIMLCFSYELGGELNAGSEAAYYIRMLAPLIPVMYLDNSVDAVLKGHGEQVYCMRVNIVDSLLSVVLLYLVLPSMGMKGYIFVIYLTEILNASLSITRLLRVTEVRPRLLKILFVPLLSIAGSTAVVRMLSYLLERRLFFGVSSRIGLLVLHISFSVFLYLFLLFLFGAVKGREIRELRYRFRNDAGRITAELGACSERKRKKFQKI